jgi:nucleotide-binding universal stress UspA family protein
VSHGEPAHGERDERDHWNVGSGEFELGTDGPAMILVGIDDTVTSLRAAAYAAGLARRQRARLVAVYVSSTSAVVVGSAGAAVLVAEAEAHDQIAAELRARFEEGVTDRGIAGTFVVAYGDPYHEIKRIADETRADAIVVGASKQAGHRFVGSLAVRLVRAGKWPVTVVP